MQSIKQTFLQIAKKCKIIIILIKSTEIKEINNFSKVYIIKNDFFGNLKSIKNIPNIWKNL